MAHGRHEICGCFPTGLPYPGITEFLLRAPPAQLGLADDLDVDRPWHEQPLAVLDTETTGKDPARGDRVEILSGLRAGETILVNPILEG